MFFPDRRFVFACFHALLLFTVLPAQAQDISVQLDGRALQFDQPPAMVGGRLMVPLRGIFEALKADVVYDGPTRSIQATKGSRVVQLQLGSRTAIIDGRTLFLDVPADTIGGRTMVPLRFVSEALGADVKWEGSTKTVKLSSTAGGQDNSSANSSGTGNGQQSGSTDTTTGPQISQVFHSATTVLKSGDTLDVVVYGEPGGKATFEVLGATKQIGLPEVSAGKYQKRWTIPAGLLVEKGVLLAHLQKNGRETAVEAKRQVTVRAGAQNNNTGNSSPQPSWKVTPAEGSTVPDYRPLVTINFPAPVNSNTLRFYVDGVDFSNQVRLTGQQLQWRPNYNLSAATHQAEVKAVGTNGQGLSHTWKFRIDPEAANQAQFKVNELRPAEGTTVQPRAQIGAIFSQNIQSVTFYVDSQLINNKQGVQRYQNGVMWTPNYNLAPGQHRASVKGVNQNGQVVSRDWNFVVGNTTISSFTVTPTTVRAGQQVRVDLVGPPGATGTFQVGQVANLPLREVSSGRYQGVYTVRAQDSGTAGVSARLKTPAGQNLTANAPSKVTFQAQTNLLSVSNLRNGMTISPVFNVQGKGQPGRTVSVLIQYSSSNILGAISGQVRSIRTQGVVTAGGHYDIPVDASAIRAGQKFRVTVSDGQSPNVVMELTRQ